MATFVLEDLEAASSDGLPKAMAEHGFKLADDRVVCSGPARHSGEARS